MSYLSDAQNLILKKHCRRPIPVLVFSGSDDIGSFEGFYQSTHSKGDSADGNSWLTIDINRPETVSSSYLQKLSILLATAMLNKKPKTRNLNTFGSEYSLRSFFDSTKFFSRWHESVTNLFRKTHRFSVTGPAIALITFASCVSAGTSQRTIYTGAFLVNPDGLTVADSRIIIESERFVCVSDSIGCPRQPGDIEFNLKQRWITPGLIDTHVHLDFNNDALAHQRRRLAHGITTVRDAATLQLDELLAYREKATGHAPLPSVVISALVNSTHAERFGSQDPTVIALNLKKLGVDFIKLRNAKSIKSSLSIITASKQAGLPVYGHTWLGPPPQAATRIAVNSGLDGVAHLMGIAIENQSGPISPMPDPVTEEAKFWEWRKNLWLSADPQALDRFINFLINKGVWLEPTLAFEYHWGNQATQSYCGILDTHHRVTFREALRWWEAAPSAPSYPAPYAVMSNFVKRFAEKGGVIVAGSDNKCPGPDLHEEIYRLREAGLRARHALRTATTEAARVLGIDHDRGRIKVGQRADFVIFEQDPLAFPHAKIETIVLRGYRHSAKTLLEPEQQLFEAKHQAARINGAIRWSHIPFVALLLLGITLRILQGRKNRIQLSINSKKHQDTTNKSDSIPKQHNS